MKKRSLALIAAALLSNANTFCTQEIKETYTEAEHKAYFSEKLEISFNDLSIDKILNDEPAVQLIAKAMHQSGDSDAKMLRAHLEDMDIKENDYLKKAFIHIGFTNIYSEIDFTDGISPAETKEALNKINAYAQLSNYYGMQVKPEEVIKEEYFIFTSKIGWGGDARDANSRFNELLALDSIAKAIYGQKYGKKEMTKAIGYIIASLEISLEDMGEIDSVKKYGYEKGYISNYELLGMLCGKIEIDCMLHSKDATYSKLKEKEPYLKK